MLARIIINEQSAPIRGETYDPREIDLIASVVLNNRTRFPGAKSWLEIMRRLAPHVTRAKEVTRAHHAWTGDLPAGCSKTRPATWDDVANGPWVAWAPHWQNFCQLVVAKWTAGDIERNHDVITWGATTHSRSHLCRPVTPAGYCLVTSVPRGNHFFAWAGAASCSAEATRAFQTAHCRR